MNEPMNKISAATEVIQSNSIEALDKLVSVAQVGKVFSEPVVIGDTTLIQVAEVVTGLGFGFGIGQGSEEAAQEQQDVDKDINAGGGGGGGGGSASRAVAVISVSSAGVEVKPIVDITKICLAFFTAFGAMMIMAGKMKKMAK